MNITLKLLVLCLISSAASAAVGSATTLYMGLATLTYLSLYIGLYFVKKQIKLHMLFMKLGITGDILLVLILEFQRSAIDTATDFNLSLPQQLHILFSTLAVIMYVPTMVFGHKLFKTAAGPKRQKLFQIHRKVAIVAFIFRTSGYFLMFSMLTHL
jgi:hypothetical protein